MSLRSPIHSFTFDSQGGSDVSEKGHKAEKKRGLGCAASGLAISRCRPPDHKTSLRGKMVTFRNRFPEKHMNILNKSISVKAKQIEKRRIGETEKRGKAVQSRGSRAEAVNSKSGWRSVSPTLRCAVAIPSVWRRPVADARAAGTSRGRAFEDCVKRRGPFCRRRSGPSVTG